MDLVVVRLKVFGEAGEIERHRLVRDLRRVFLLIRCLPDLIDAVAWDDLRLGHCGARCGSLLRRWMLALSAVGLRNREGLRLRRADLDA